MLLAIVVKMYTRTCYERVRTKGKMLKFKLTDRSSLKSMKMKMSHLKSWTDSKGKRKIFKNSLIL